MSKIGKLEEIKAWQEARELVKEIYSATNKGRFARDFGLRDQIRRASVSVMSNEALPWVQLPKFKASYMLPWTWHT
jgi:hypothetical protein